jgi:cob(I)alamin adenosyltransferase
MMSAFYTATGDDGYTGLLKGGRVAKTDPILDAVGTIDEANAALGLGRSISQTDLSKKMILTIQGDLYHLMAEVSASPENADRFRKIDLKRVAWLEAQIDILGAEVQMPTEFIVPGDSLPGAALDLARTAIRRAERRVTGLVHEGVIENHELLRYLNRLSSLCFMLECYENQIAGKDSPTYAREI